MKDRIRKLRKTLDLTQEEFSKRLGITRTAVAQYETGRNDPVSSVVSLICKEFNVNEEWLRTGSGEMFVQMSKEDKLLEWMGEVVSDDKDAFRRRFVSALAKLDVKDWLTIEKLIYKMIDENEEPLS